MKTTIAIDPAHLIADGKQGWITDNGVFYRKGTTSATFENAQSYQAVIDQGITDINDPVIQTAINDQRFITNMMAVGGYFSLFPPWEWFSNKKAEGRMMPALLLLQQFPNKITDEIQNTLLTLSDEVSPVTKLLIQETLLYFKKFQDKFFQAKSYISMLFEKYIDGLHEKNIHKIISLWLESESSVLLVPGSDHMIRGTSNIIDFTKQNFANFLQITFEIGQLVVEVDFIKGIAQLYAEKKLIVNLQENNKFEGKAIPTKALVNVEFQRLDIPSCQPLLDGFSDWRIGNWKITKWFEMFPISQFKP